VEVLNRLAEHPLRDDREDLFELAKGFTSVVGCLGAQCREAHALGDEATEAPVVLAVVVVVLLRIVQQREEVQVLAIALGITVGL